MFFLFLSLLDNLKYFGKNLAVLADLACFVAILCPCAVWVTFDHFGSSGLFVLWLFGINWFIFGYNWHFLLFGHFSAILDSFW